MAAPVVTSPGPQSINRNRVLTFNSANGNAIVVEDVDDAGDLTCTLAVTSGTLTLGALTGLSFSQGDGTADAAMEFAGTAAEITTALSGLKFVPTANTQGGVTLTVTVEDDDEESDTEVIPITIIAQQFETNADSRRGSPNVAPAFYR